MTRGKSTNKFGIVALKPSAKQKLTIVSRKRMTWLQRLMVATAGWQKTKRLGKITSPKDTVPNLICASSGRQASSSKDKANLLAEFFCTAMYTDHGKSADVEQGTPYPLLESHLVFTFPTIPEQLVLRELLRLKVNKSTGDPLHVQSISKKMSTFSGQLYHLPVQPLPVNLLLPMCLESCQGHPSLQKPRFPIRSIKLPPSITPPSNRKSDGWHPERSPNKFPDDQQINFSAPVWICSPKFNCTPACIHHRQVDAHSRQW